MLQEAAEDLQTRAQLEVLEEAAEDLQVRAQLEVLQVRAPEGGVQR